MRLTVYQHPVSSAESLVGCGSAPSKLICFTIAQPKSSSGWVARMLMRHAQPTARMLCVAGVALQTRLLRKSEASSVTAYSIPEADCEFQLAGTVMSGFASAGEMGVPGCLPSSAAVVALPIPPLTGVAGTERATTKLAGEPQPEEGKPGVERCGARVSRWRCRQATAQGLSLCAGRWCPGASYR